MAFLKSISTSTLPDAELMQLYRQDPQQETLAWLYLRYSDLVYGTCVKYLKDQEAAKDAVMDIYQQLPEKLKTHHVDNFKSWLYVVSKNHCLMQLRRNKKMPVTALEPEFMQSEDFRHLDIIKEKEQNLNRLGN
jgi:RNA polymerase sigma factor (sigma-70 family)